MWRGSKMSFWVPRPTNQMGQLHIELPLLASPRTLLNGLLAHQIRALDGCPASRKKERRWQRLLRKYGEAMDRRETVLATDSAALLAWNLLIFLLVVLNLIEIPIVLMVVNSYNETHEKSVARLVYQLALFILILDMLLVRPRISYEQGGRIITKSEEVLRHYLQGNFWMDLVGVLVIALSFLPVANIDYLRLLFFIRIVPLQEINRQIKSKLLTARFPAALYDFMRLVLFIVLVTNLYACVYFAIDRYYYDQQGNFYQQGFLWLNGSYGLGNLDLLETFGSGGAYIYALFWALQTARTCGYGVATPKNYVEVLYTNFVMLNIVVIFVYFTNGVVKLILTYSEDHKRKLNSVKRAIDAGQEFGLPTRMKDKMVEFITDFKNPEVELEEEMELMLSPILRYQFKLAFMRHFIDLISLVSLITDESGEAELFRVDVASIIRRRHYQAGQIIFKSKEQAVGRLLLIQRGFCTAENASVGYRKFQSEWGLVGRREFYFQTRPIYTVVANEYVSGLELEGREFTGCLKKYGRFYEKYREIIQRILISQQGTEPLHIKCAFCDMHHMHEHCPVGNSWRSEMRIKRIWQGGASESVPQPRAQVRRRAIPSSRVINISLGSTDTDWVHRTTLYFHHYNL